MAHPPFNDSSSVARVDTRAAGRRLSAPLELGRRPVPPMDRVTGWPGAIRRPGLGLGNGFAPQPPAAVRSEIARTAEVYPSGVAATAGVFDELGGRIGMLVGLELP